jgi:hypothetical protein
MIVSTRLKAVTRQGFTGVRQCVFFLDGIFVQL